MDARRAILALIAAPLLWGGNYVAGRYLAGNLSPLVLNALRWTISALIFLVIVRAQGLRIPLWRERRAFLWLGLTGMFGFSALLYLGLSLLPASVAGAISGLQPVAILLTGVAINQLRPAGRSWAGVSISFIGVLLLTGSGLAIGHMNVLGALDILGASALWGVYTALGRRSGMAPLVATAGAAVYGAVPSILLGVLALRGAPIHPTLGMALAVLYVSTAASVGAYLLWNYGVREAGSTRAASFINLLPVFSILLGILLLGEHLTPIETIGAVVVIVGAWLAGSAPAGSQRRRGASAGPIGRN